MPNFRPQAPLVWEENEVRDSRKYGQNVLTVIHNEISNSGGIILCRIKKFIKHGQKILRSKMGCPLIYYWS